MSQSKPETEAAVRAACEAQDFGAATDLTLRAHGAEILSFLGARMGSRSDAEEVFSSFAEDVWLGLSGFAFRCSLRGWLYTLANNAAHRYLKAPHRKRELNNLSVVLHASVANLIQAGRSNTEPHRRTDVKDRVRALQQRMPAEDQTLLMLHIDRGLPWRELAMVLHPDGEQLQGDALTTEAARLRKRYERIRASLRELAIADGLIRGTSSKGRVLEQRSTLTPDE